MTKHAPPQDTPHEVHYEEASLCLRSTFDEIEHATHGDHWEDATLAMLQPDSTLVKICHCPARYAEGLRDYLASTGATPIVIVWEC